MKNLLLLPATVEFAADLYQFELDNRAFFEAHINARSDAYYSLDAVTQALHLAEHEARSDVGYQFLICDSALNIVGRINLTRVRRAHFHSAELGYRIAEMACGKGYASDAIRQVLDKAFLELDLKRIEAAVRVSNVASIRALQRNGFSQYGHAKRSFELNGIWHDVLHFEAHAVLATTGTT
jgi:ribosomal-protein-alanine N-acetyltransferase